MTKLEELLAEADAIVRGADDDLLEDGNLKIIKVSYLPSGELVATVRGENGYPIIYPHPESASILVAKEVYFNLLVNGPRIIRALVDIAENRGIESKTAKNPGESA